MKIINAEQARAVDAQTIQFKNILSVDLMEQAAWACASRITELTDRKTEYYIVCGKGNNGGDGLAIARMLAGMKRKVVVFVIEYGQEPARDFLTNLKRLEHQMMSQLLIVTKSEDLHFSKKENAIIIDALFGTGLNRAVEGLAGDVIAIINKSGIPVIAIDVPSGLPCDDAPVKGQIIKAYKTLTFQRPKFTFLFADNYPYVGEFEFLDIGLDEGFIESLESRNHYLMKRDIASLIKLRGKFSNKGTFGHALLIAGSEGKMGAAIMAAGACLRSGAGLLTVHVPSCGVDQFKALPETMISKDEHESFVSVCPKIEKYTAVGVGPGTGTAKETAQVLKVLIQESQSPLVLDADALNILSENKTWLAFLPETSVLTPHPKEFDRLTGSHSSDWDRLISAREFSQKYKIILILKGAHTAIIHPGGDVFFNSSGNPALAKGGSGDVLTGMILGLLAQGYSPIDSSLIAVYTHGLAADLFVQENNIMSMLTSDLINLIPQAFQQLQSV